MEEPAGRRGGVWVSDAARPPWAAPGSVPPAASRPGRWRPAAAPVAGQMQVAGEPGVLGPFDMSIRAKRKMATARERWAEDARAALAARTRPWSGPGAGWDGARGRPLQTGLRLRASSPTSLASGRVSRCSLRAAGVFPLPHLLCDYFVSRAGSTPPDS